MAEHSSRGKAWEKVRLAVLDRDGWVCVWCGKDLIGSDATADHYPVPVSKGGPDEMWNLVAACRRDNGQRQDRELTRMTGCDPAWLDPVFL